MKTKLFRFIAFTLAALLLFAPLLAIAQAVDTTGLADWKPFEGPITVDKLMQVFNPVYGAIVIVWGYVARALGFKNKKIPFVFVILAGGLVAAGVFLTQGFSAVGIVISFLASLGIFDLILSPAEKLIKPKIAPPEPEQAPSHSH
jgi:hypothetical protein